MGAHHTLTVLNRSTTLFPFVVAANVLCLRIQTVFLSDMEIAVGADSARGATWYDTLATSMEPINLLPVVLVSLAAGIALAIFEAISKERMINTSGSAGAGRKDRNDWIRPATSVETNG
ncbi:hypothetical protein R1T40_21420 (plasmid) [Tritonibacter scottomollicae]|uniref:Uncharacterized protein n=1 Tax=Tritonibacter scottomollicae TaxID=483013 RepID=A0ABZ0HLG8_TRISK|nr:hypothetical protein [Tritonibacter scottomollicae]WOI35504.1 hypothetical protein R1T40_21420 [Tritonibacter scottomollicae]